MPHRGIGALAAIVLLAVVGGMTPVHAPLPFMPGERMTYRVHVNGMGTIGESTMTVEGPVDVRGTATYLLRSKTTAGIGPIKGSSLTESWLDPVRMTALRFHEREHRLLSTRDARVEIYPDEQRWVDAKGATGESLTTAPLDELSFIYFLRSLPMEPDTAYQFNRHFDATRNPIAVRVMRGDTVTTPVSVFSTVLIEMRVRDPRRYHGEGVIRVHLSNDACRIPVRIESDVPGTGSLVLTLESYAHPAPGCNVTDHLSAQ